MVNDIKVDNRKDFLLLLLYSKGETDSFNESITGRTRMMKMMFLFKEEALEYFKKNTPVNEDNFYEFFAWSFGPFSLEVYDDITFFDLLGFLNIKDSKERKISESYSEWERWLDETSMDGVTRIEDMSLSQIDTLYEEEFLLTQKGEDYAKKLYDTISSNQKELLMNFKFKLVSAPLRGILRYVYQRYPKMTDRSIIKNNILSGHHPA